MAKFNLWTWFKNIFHNVIKHADLIAITVTEDIKEQKHQHTTRIIYSSNSSMYVFCSTT